MNGFLMRTVAVAALVLTPLSAMAQGGPGGPGPAGGPGPGREGGNAMQHGGGMEHGGMQRGEGMRGDRGGDRHDADRGDRGDRRDADRGPRNDRRDADRSDGADRRDADRGDRMERRDVDRADRIDRPGQMRRDERVGERGARRGPARVVSTEQRTRIRSVIRERGFDSVRGGDFAVRVGAAVPARYRFRPLPPELLTYVPEYEGYDYIVVDDQILILDPDTREVVAIIS